MHKGYFITGTDTEVGKTLVSSLLIQHFVEQGKRVLGMKPIASGSQLIDGVLKNEDALSLIAAANVEVEYEQVNPYCFAPPIAPHIAAQQANTRISLSKINDSYHVLAQQADLVVVEGKPHVDIDALQDVVLVVKDGTVVVDRR